MYKNKHTQYIDLCDAASEDMHPIGDWVLIKSVSRRGGLCCVYQSNSRKELAVVFRGTSASSLGDSLLNVADDLYLGFGSHHKGFQRHARRFKDVAGWVEKKAIDMEYVVTCTGMSLGGAVACMFSKWLNCLVVTFGCPKFTKDPLSFKNRRTMHHYLIKSDVVGLLPPGRRWKRPGKTTLMADMPGADHVRNKYVQALERLA